jgi:hypothetical protein
VPQNNRNLRAIFRMRLDRQNDRTGDIFVKIRPANPALQDLQDDLVGLRRGGGGTSSSLKSRALWNRNAFISFRLSDR